MAVQKIKMMALLLLIFAVLCVTVEGQDQGGPWYTPPVAQTYTPFPPLGELPPDPLLNPYVCSPSNLMPSLICDPSNFLTYQQRDALQQDLMAIRNRGTCPCGNPTCEASYTVSIAIIERVPTGHIYGNAEAYVKMLAKSLDSSEWKHGDCGETVVIVYSVRDNVFATSFGHTARSKVTDGCREETELVASGYLIEGQSYQALSHLVYQYKQYLNGESFCTIPSKSTQLEGAYVALIFISVVILFGGTYFFVICFRKCTGSVRQRPYTGPPIKMPKKPHKNQFQAASAPPTAVPNQYEIATIGQVGATTASQVGIANPNKVGIIQATTRPIIPNTTVFPNNRSQSVVPLAHIGGGILHEMPAHGVFPNNPQPAAVTLSMGEGHTQGQTTARVDSVMTGGNAAVTAGPAFGVPYGQAHGLGGTAKHVAPTGGIFGGPAPTQTAVQAAGIGTNQPTVRNTGLSGTVFSAPYGQANALGTSETAGGPTSGSTGGIFGPSDEVAGDFGDVGTGLNGVGVGGALGAW